MPWAKWCLFADRMQGGGWRAKIYDTPELEVGVYGVPSEGRHDGETDILLGHYRNDIAIGGNETYPTSKEAFDAVLHRVRRILKGVGIETPFAVVNAYYVGNDGRIHKQVEHETC